MEPQATPLDLSQIQLIESIFLECLISNPSLVPTSPAEIAGFAPPGLRLLPMVSVRSNKVAFDIRVHVVTLDAEQQPLPVEGAFRIYLAFRIDNLAEQLYYDERTNQEIPTAPLTAALIGTAYSTARGMIMSKVTDTILAGFALPLRSVKQLMEDAQPSLEEVNAARADAAAKLQKTRKRKVSPKSNK